jgi:hypothetical protein
MALLEYLPVALAGLAIAFRIALFFPRETKRAQRKHA